MPLRTSPAFCLLLCACGFDPKVGPPEDVNGRKAPEIVLDHRGLGVPVDTLPSTVLSASDSFGVIGGVTIVGDKLVVGQREAPYFLVLDRRSGAIVRSFGRAGEGPGEFRMAPEFLRGVPNTQDRFWVGSWMGQSLVALPAHAAPPGEPEPSPLRVRPSLSKGSIHGLRLGENRLLLTGQSKDGLVQFGMFDTLGVLQQQLSPIAHVDDRLFDKALQSAFEFRLCANTSGTRFALAYANTGMLRVRGVDDSIVTEAEVPYRFRLHLPPIGRLLREFKPAPGGRRAYLSCVATDSLLYAFFSGELLRKPWNRPPVDNVFLHVFTWDGRLVRVHQLDHYAFSGALDPVTHELYTTSLWPDSGTVRRTVLPR